MEIAGYIAAIMIGVSLGLIGGGGSILTVPVLVYLFGLDAMQATSYSLFIVGSTSLVGAARNYKAGQVNVRVALLFGISSITTVWLTRHFLIPAIPKVLFTIGNTEVTRSALTLVLFALLMFFASLSMIRSGGKATSEDVPAKHHSAGSLMMPGIGIGFVTGFLGAGGGFLLIPALVLLMGLEMKVAIGTSLFIIALNSLIGFTGDLGHGNIDWNFLLTITAIAVAGILVGTQLGKKIHGSKLKKGFGWFVLIMAIYIIIKETLLK